MSLFTDLREVFTAYAQRIKGLAADNEQIRADLNTLDEKVDNIDVFPDAAKNALLDCFKHVALFTGGAGQVYIDNLRDALNGYAFPDLSTGNVVSGYYLDASGNPVASGNNYYNDKYFEIVEDTDYYWIQGFNGRVSGTSPNFTGYDNAYRICYYTNNKEFISREINDRTSFGTAEPRYLKLTIPNGAKYFRVSWNLLPCGAIYRAIPTDLYAVTIVLANLDDSSIDSTSVLPSKISFTRNGQNVTNIVKTGNLTVQPVDSIDTTNWVKNIFNILRGESPEYGAQNPATTIRCYNCHSYIMQAGDVISFNGVKAGVRAERIYDGNIQHSTAWITDDSDFIVGGE